MDDEQAKLINLKGFYHRSDDWSGTFFGTDCNLGGCRDPDYLRGFEATWSRSGGVTETHCFGECVDYITSNIELPLSEELMYFTMVTDINDIEGLAFRDY